MVTHVLIIDTTDALGDSLRAFWELESLGIEPDEKNPYDDPKATSHLVMGDMRYHYPGKQFINRSLITMK